MQTTAPWEPSNGPSLMAMSLLAISEELDQMTFHCRDPQDFFFARRLLNAERRRLAAFLLTTY